MSKTSIITENTARDRWCPMAWDGSGGNRDSFGRPKTECLCLGSKCGCWLTIGNPDNEIGRCGLVRV